MNTLQLHPAFTDPVGQSQTIFRALLKSMSEPGVISPVPTEMLQEHPSSAAIYASTWSIARALFDFDSHVYVSPELTSETLVRSLQFQTEAKIAQCARDAQFVMLNLTELSELETFNLGTMEAPHISSTVLVQVEGFDQGDHFSISGPGIQGLRTIQINGLNAQHRSLIARNHALYPCGVDFIFCSPQAMLALPRSTRATELSVNTGGATCM